eukprot:11465213-Alexandrium_andersonii.AAC.1
METRPRLACACPRHVDMRTPQACACPHHTDMWPQHSCTWTHHRLRPSAAQLPGQAVVWKLGQRVACQ